MERMGENEGEQGKLVLQKPAVRNGSAAFGAFFACGKVCGSCGAGVCGDGFGFSEKAVFVSKLRLLI